MEKITLGGGCFWCLEAIYQQIPGILTATSGYAGGHTPNPSYETVCRGNTGHAEVVQLSFDPAQITCEKLLDVFFAIHDPTTLNRQGHDIGTQYRSIILYHSPEQASLAKSCIEHLNQTKKWPTPIVTQVEPFTVFYPAEENHQNFMQNNPHHPYCQYVILPKINKWKT